MSRRGRAILNIPVCLIFLKYILCCAGRVQQQQQQPKAAAPIHWRNLRHHSSIQYRIPIRRGKDCFRCDGCKWQWENGRECFIHIPGSLSALPITCWHALDPGYVLLSRGIIQSVQGLFGCSRCIQCNPSAYTSAYGQAFQPRCHHGCSTKPSPRVHHTLPRYAEGLLTSYADAVH